MKKSLFIALFTFLGIQSAQAIEIRCKTNAEDLRAELVATLSATNELRNVRITEVGKSAGVYGSSDDVLKGTVRGNYVRFAPSGFVNSYYRFALPKGYEQRASFPLFLDTLFEGYSDYFARRLSCRLVPSSSDF